MLARPKFFNYSSTISMQMRQVIVGSGKNDGIDQDGVHIFKFGTNTIATTTTMITIIAYNTR